MPITDLPLSFTPIAGGAFADGYASRMAGGLHVAATTVARNAIPDYRREEGMLCWVTAGTGFMYQLKAGPWTGTDADWDIFSLPADSDIGGFHNVDTTAERNAIPQELYEEGMLCWVKSGAGTMYQLREPPWTNTDTDWQPFSSGLSRVTYDFLNGEESTDLTTLTPQVIGAIYFDPNTIIPVSSGRIRHVDFECVIETSVVTSYARIDLYDVNAISTGGIPGVVANSTQQTTNLAPTRFTQNLDAELGALTTAGLIEARLAIQSPGPGFASCKLARLIVTWE